MQFKNILFVVVLFAASSANAAETNTSKDSVIAAAYALIKRVLPEKLHKSFEVKIIESVKGKDVFE